MLSDRHKKSATRIEGGLSPPSSIDLNIAMIGKIFEMAKIGEKEEGVQKVFGTLDLFVSLLETEIKYPILQGGILPFWTPSFFLFKRIVFSLLSKPPKLFLDYS